jgi:hypothetical protein
MIIFSLRGKMFRKLVEDFRKLFSILQKSANEKQLFKAIYLSIMIFYSFLIVNSIFISVFFYSEERVLPLKPIYLFIAELQIEMIYFLTEFYVLYFTSYLVILQKLFKSELKEYNNQRIIITEKSLVNIKFKIDSIQSLIERISGLLSPMLLFICGTIFYDLVSCLYFTIKSIEFSAYFKSGFLPPNIGLFMNLLRLICICFCAERLVFQVFFFNLKKKILILLLN